MLQANYGAGDKPVTFVTEADQALFKALKAEPFEVQVRLPSRRSRTSVASMLLLSCALWTLWTLWRSPRCC